MAQYPRTPSRTTAKYPLSPEAREEAMQAALVSAACRHLPNSRSVCRRCGAMFYVRLDYWDAPLKRPPQAFWRVIQGAPER